MRARDSSATVGVPRGNDPQENPGLHCTSHRHELGSASKMHYMSVSQIQNPIYTYTRAWKEREWRGAKKQSLENDGKDLHHMKLLDILEQQSFPGLYVVLCGWSSTTIRTARR